MSRRAVLLALVVAVGLASLFLILRSGGSASPTASPPSPTPKKLSPRARKTAAAIATRTTALSRIPVDIRRERSYAARLAPTIDHGVQVFDSLARSAAAAPLGSGAQAASCGASVKGAGIQEGQVDGIPHPYPWYSRVGYLHRQILGIYHDMLGASIACQTSAGNGDQGGASTAVADMQGAARNLRQVDRRIHVLAAQLH